MKKRSQLAIQERSVLSKSGQLTPVKQKSYLRRLASAFTLRSLDVWSSVIGGSAGVRSISNPQAALQLSAVWAAVRRYSETVGSLPLHLYRWTDNGPELVEDSDSVRVLTMKPNADQTPMEFWEGMQGSTELCGEALAIKEKVNGRVVALRQVNPQEPVTTIERSVTGSIVYRIAEKDRPPRDYGPDDVLHIRGFSLGGLRGISPVAAGGASLALALNAERSAQNVFINGLRVSGFIKTNRLLEEPDRARIQKNLEKYMGGDNAGGMMLLEGGMDFDKVGMNPIDAELLTTRKFEIEEIGRWFDMPPILLGHAVPGQTMWGSGVDSIVQSWMTLGLRQRLIRNQQALRLRVLTDRERAERIYPKYNPDALLEVNSLTRMQVLSTAVQNSLLKPNEARQKLDKGPVPGGDVALAQVNLVPLDQLGENGSEDSRVKAMLQSWLVPEGVKSGEPNREPEPTE